MLRLMALVAGLAQATLMSVSPVQAAETAAELKCDLHVWGGGYPARVMKSNAFVKVTIDPAEADLSNPMSNASLYSTVNRARAWPDAELAKLMPATRDLKIVRHPEVLDLDKFKLKSVKTRLSASTVPCYADLVVANMYGIFPNPDFQGLLVDAIDGGNRLVMDLWMQQHSAGQKTPVVFRKKNDAPLLSFRAERPLYAESVADASAKILVAFGNAASKKQAKTK